MQQWEVEVQGPSAFLRGIYDLDAGLFVTKLHQQAAAVGVPFTKLLHSLGQNVPGFIQYLCEDQGIVPGLER